MLEKFWRKLKIVFLDQSLRKRILFVLLFLVIFRILAAIPLPGIDVLKLKQILAHNQFFGILDVFSAGGISKLSIIMMGVGPYITSSIIMQLLTIMVPRLKSLYHEEGEIGRRKFIQYSRLLTVPLAFIQSMGMLHLFQKEGIFGNVSSFEMILNVIIVTTGSILLMWIGELISEYGIGNGVSLLIFAGIVARIPGDIGQILVTFDKSQIPLYIAFLTLAFVIIAGVVFINEAERAIPVTYTKRTRGLKVFGGVSTYLPLRLNQAGVIPIIFALSILMFPQMLGHFLVGSSFVFFQKIGNLLISFSQKGLLYGIFYFILVFAFTYFYTAITFDPKALSENLQRNGAFIPGIRPGQMTIEYISNLLLKITLVGALFLGLIAVLPLVMQSIFSLRVFAIGGTSLLIVVSVVIDLIKKVDAQIAMREY